MPPDLYSTIVKYHDETKHHPRRYARSLGYLDWATQPDPFRRFADAPLIQLPLRAADDTPPYEDLFEAGRVAPAPLILDAIGRFFELSMAVSAWKQAGESRWALRCNPSSGNLHPTESYVVLPPIDGLHDRPAVYHYAPLEHALERRCEFEQSAWVALSAEFGPGAFLGGLSSVYWREAWKYGERAFRYCQHDIGHAIGALRIAAATLGWRLIVLDTLGDDDVARLLGLDREQDFENAEREHPELIAVVYPADGRPPPPPDLPPDATESIAAAEWTGRANRLSPSRVQWDIIDAAAAATRKSRAVTRYDTPRSAAASEPQLRAPPSTRCGLSMRQIAVQRRSAVAFDGETSIAADLFFHMLCRVVPSVCRHAPPWDAIPWPPYVSLFLFVHLVDGLSPGLYVLVRDPNKVEALKRTTKPDFAWTRPAGCPDELPLFTLLRGDCRQAAAQLSLGQEIAGMSAFSMAMVAQFEAPLREIGPWLYRRLFWEAGLIGHVLYLEAEAAGVRATGIGAFFDDPVHDLLGLADHRFQSLYHFTVGGPVEDPRVSTLPPYPPDRYR